ncbi:MAG TPA: ABC transporter ATP-binding protein [Kiritimatiellia bacterium]
MTDAISRIGPIGQIRPILSLHDVHTYYGHLHALKGITLEVREGEIVALLGSNGAGKSTTLRTVSGLARSRSGDIEFRGSCIRNRPAHEIASLGVGHVPEGRRVFPRLTVEENLDIGAFHVRDNATIADRKRQVYELFPRIAERRRQAGGTLSGGEQQMLAIGRALMQDPPLLLLDEPTLGLAPVLVDTIFETILRLNRAGKTLLLVEQNAGHALQVSHRGYVLQTGEVMLHGPAPDLAANPMVRKCYLGEE